MARIIIIGGGVAGLSAGIYAKRNGFDAVVCERHFVAGGNLTGWQRGEYHIDNCIHWLTGTNPNTDTYKIWTELGALGNVPVHQPETLYTVEYRGKRLSLYRNIDKLEEEMLAVSPADERETRAFIRAIKTLMHFNGISGEKSILTEKIFSVPALLRYYRLSTEELAERFSSPLIRKFLVDFLSNRFGALALLFVFATFCGDNGGIPKGGSLAMAQRLSARFTELGGELLLKKEAAKINLQGGKANSVSFTDGTTVSADYVIVATDTKLTFGTLLDKPMPAALQRLYENPATARFSSYHAAFSCDVESLPFRSDFILKIPKSYKPALQGEHLILREFSHEKDFAPRGKTVLQAMIFCDEKTSQAFIELRKNKTAYRQKKQQIARAMQALIAEKFPAFSTSIKLLDVWTPATYHRYTQAEMGSYMSFILPKKSLPRALKSEITGVKNVFLATQWQQSPGGLPIAAKLGKLSIEKVLQAEKRQALSRQLQRLLLPRRRKQHP